MNKVFMTALLGLAITVPALAHEGGHHVKGVIKELTPERLVLTEATGKDVAFVVTQATGFFREGKPVKREDAKPGERAVVHGAAGGGTTAAEVMLGAAPAAH
jgi:thiamine monophosphate kinase